MAGERRLHHRGRRAAAFEEAARLFFTLIRTEEKASTTNAIERLGDDALRRARASTMAYASELDFEGYIGAFARRASILREWQRFFEQYPLLLMPVSCQRPFPVDFDQRGDEAVEEMLNCASSDAGGVHARTARAFDPYRSGGRRAGRSATGAGQIRRGDLSARRRGDRGETAHGNAD